MPHAIAAQSETAEQHEAEVRASTRCGFAEQHAIEAQDATPHAIAAQALTRDEPVAPDVMRELHAALAAIHSSAGPPYVPQVRCEPQALRLPPDCHAQRHDSQAQCEPVPSSASQPQPSPDARDWY